MCCGPDFARDRRIMPEIAVQPSEPISVPSLQQEEPVLIVCPACHSSGDARGEPSDWDRNYLCAHCGMAWIVRAGVA